jgi:hypothetical protein
MTESRQVPIFRHKIPFLLLVVALELLHPIEILAVKEKDGNSVLVLPLLLWNPGK